MTVVSTWEVEMGGSENLSSQCSRLCDILWQVCSPMCLGFPHMCNGLQEGPLGRMWAEIEKMKAHKNLAGDRCFISACCTVEF